MAIKKAPKEYLALTGDKVFFLYLFSFTKKVSDFPVKVSDFPVKVSDFPKNVSDFPI